MRTTPAVQRSLILNAFGDAAGTHGESLPFLKAVGGEVDRTEESVYCEAVVEAELVIGNPEAMIGDVCVGTASWSYDLHFSKVNDWASRRNPPLDVYGPSGGWWRMLDAQGKEVAPGFENVQQCVVVDPALANEVLGAAKGIHLPKRPASVTAKIARFHADPATWRSPKYFSYRTCGGEVSGDNFWHGATEDRLAREYMSALMRSSGINRKARPESIVTFSAMEAVPWMSAVSRWNDKTSVSMPMVVIRAASNYDQIPLRPDGSADP